VCEKITNLQGLIPQKANLKRPIVVVIFSTTRHPLVGQGVIIVEVSRWRSFRHTRLV